MKFCSCLFAFLFCLQTAQSQITDRSIPIGFLTETAALQPLGNDRWLVAGRNIPYPGGYFEDSLFVAVFDAEGELAWLKFLDLPQAETHYIHDALVLPDESILVCFESTLCDVVGDQTLLQKLDNEGNLLWEIQSNWGSADAIPQRLHLTPDGNFMGERDGKVTKYDAADGSILWQTSLATTDWIFDLSLLPGTEDFGASGSSTTFQFWKQSVDASGNIVYNQTMSEGIPGLGFPQVQFAENGWIYAYGQYEGKFYRFDPLGNFTSMPDDFSWVQQLSPLPDGLLLMGRENGENRLAKTDFDGENATQITMPEGWLQGIGIAVSGANVAITGMDGSGPKSTLEDMYPWFEATHLWFRTFTGFNPTEPDELLSAAISEVQSQADLTVDTVGNTSFPLYNISGGDFSVLIKNTGSIVLDEVWVNTRFDWSPVSICLTAPVGRRHYTGLALAPGESVSLSFGDITATAQPQLPEKYCFWTSAPNGKPDQLHIDDAGCFGGTVSVEETKRAALQIFPNPTTNFLTLRSGDAFTPGERWRLLDAVGHVAAEGICPAGTKELKVEAGNLPAGFYFLSLPGRMAKVVVQHE